MIANRMQTMLGAGKNSAIRLMFEEGKRMAKEFGKENVYDFSLGNPNGPVPREVKESIYSILEGEDPLLVHGYMNNAGFEDVRSSIADSLNRRFQTNYGANQLIMTVGAASALNVVLRSVLDPGDEVVTVSPYFVEYGNYVRNHGGELVTVPALPDTFLPDIGEMARHIGKKTKAILLNTPNNPTGVVYPAETLLALGEMIREKEKELGTEICVISDEPYRELVYDGVEVPWIPHLIPKTIVVYSYSKSLSLPGERIGWILVPEAFSDFEQMISVMVITNRCMGSVNAPSLIQRVIGRCVDVQVDVGYYDRNRRRLYETLTQLGFTCTKPEGAFYLFVKVPGGDEERFLEVCKSQRVLLVPGSAFGCGGYVRIAYCVHPEVIERSLPSFAKIAEAFGIA